MLGCAKKTYKINEYRHDAVATQLSIGSFQLSVNSTMTTAH